MAEQPFKVGRNAKELLRYTLRATRTVSDDISRSDARAVFQKAAALEDVKDIQKVCETAVHALDTKNREGFTKSTYRLYGEGIRMTARQILLDAYAANNVNFQTDYDKRLEKIGIISVKKSAIWTKKVTDVKYPAMKWLTSERERAESLRQTAEKEQLQRLVKALRAALAPPDPEEEKASG